MLFNNYTYRAAGVGNLGGGRGAGGRESCRPVGVVGRPAALEVRLDDVPGIRHALVARQVWGGDNGEIRDK